MKIVIEKEGIYYKADCVDIPGSPRLGFGKTKSEAVADLFIQIQKNNYWKYIDTNILMVDGAVSIC